MEVWNNLLKTKIKLDYTVYKVQIVTHREYSVRSLEAQICKYHIYRNGYFLLSELCGTNKYLM